MKLYDDEDVFFHWLFAIFGGVCLILLIVGIFGLCIEGMKVIG